MRSAHLKVSFIFSQCKLCGLIVISTMSVVIHRRHRLAISQHLSSFGMDLMGGDCVFIILSDEAHDAERWFSWVTFPLSDMNTGLFHSYTHTVDPDQSVFENVVIVPLTYWQHSNWFGGNLPVATEVTLGPVRIRPASVSAGVSPRPPDEGSVSQGGAQASAGAGPSGSAVNTTTWVDGLVALFEAVFPHTDRIGRFNIVQVCSTKDWIPRVKEPTSWGCALAAVHVTAHGTPSVAVIPEIVRRVQERYGPALALDVGLKFLDDFQVVSDMIFSNMEDGAAIVATRDRHTRIQVADRGRRLPVVVSEDEGSLASVRMGVRPDKRHRRKQIVPTKNPGFGSKQRGGMKSKNPVQIKGKFGGDLVAETSQKSDFLRGGTQVKAPGTVQERDIGSVRKRGDMPPAVVRPRRNSQRSLEVEVSQGQGPRSRPPAQMRQVNITVKDAPSLGDVAAAPDLSTVCSKGHYDLLISDSSSSESD